MMKKITLETISKANQDEIYAFELTNRAFFEKSVPSRGDLYYDLDTFHGFMEELIREDEAGMCCMRIMRNEEGIVVGRVNVTNIENKSGEIGYRIGEMHCGKGYAKEGIRLMILEVKANLQLESLEAATSTKNIGSQIALLKNGFEFLSRKNEALHLNGQLIDEVRFVNHFSE